ncbi:mitotic-spindle organizing protein 2B [Penaeus vannamei]|uniref:mitotic-spindle organizing protein 2B n=1 Tax=Penaeus vannamei TaxID=6689 RepID=UPI000F676130|nr:mitotic-spindle organizing protein 2-like [Penaeus vannamei]XP_027207095.1 mitotic-spindle organizing protein 2-like [Penaeus vannamei]
MSEVHQYILVTKNNLTSDQRKLYDLVQAAGIVMHPTLFKSIMDLLNEKVPPHALLNVLKEQSGRILNRSNISNDNFLPEEFINGNMR